MALETQTGTQYHYRGVGLGGRWEGGPKRREYMYTLWLINVEVRQKTTNSVPSIKKNKLKREK